MMQSYYKTVRTYVLWLVVTGVFVPMCIIVSYVTGTRRYDSRLYFWLTTWWNKLLIATAFLDVRIKNQQVLPAYPHEPAIFVINHTSALDIPLVEYVVGAYPHVWMSKDEYGRIPLFGVLMRRQHILVKRNDASQAACALVRACTLVRYHARHLLLFPEGTRSRSGKLQPFLRGFVVLAQKLQRPIIPLYISGAYDVMPGNSKMIDPRAARVTVTVGARIAGGTTAEEAQQCYDAVAQWFAVRQNEI